MRCSSGVYTSCPDMMLLTANLLWRAKPIYFATLYISTQHILRRYVAHFIQGALKRKVCFIFNLPSSSKKAINRSSLIFPYGAECWCLEKSEERKTDAVGMQFWRRLLKIPRKKSEPINFRSVQNGKKLRTIVAKKNMKTCSYNQKISMKRITIEGLVQGKRKIIYEVRISLNKNNRKQPYPLHRKGRKQNKQHSMKLRCLKLSTRLRRITAPNSLCPI